MKRHPIKTALLAALLVLCLPLGSACGVRQNGPAPDAGEDLIWVGMSQVGAESDWRVANSESMKEVFTEENGYRLLFDDARQKQENQITAIRKFIQQQVDYIVLMPICEGGWESVLQEAREAGIPVILVDRMADLEDETLYAARIGSDFLQEGRAAVEWLEGVCPAGEGLNILHLQGTPGSTAQLGRTAALEEALARHEDWQLLARLDGGFTRAKAYEALSEHLDSQPGEAVDAVYCENDNIAFGAIQALEERGYVCGMDGVKVIAFDATRNALLECLRGRISLAVECNPLLGPLVEQTIRDLEAGRTPVRQQYVPEQVFTAAQLSVSLIRERPY